MSTQQVFRNTLTVILTVAGAYALFLSARILIVLLVAIIVASAIRPLVLWISSGRIPYGLAILMVYLGLALLIFGMAIVVLPPATNQLAEYIEHEDRLATRVITAQRWVQTNLENRLNMTNVQLLDEGAIRTTITDVVQQLRDSIPALAGQFGGVFGDFVLTVIMGIYWLTSRDITVEYLLKLFALPRRPRINEIIMTIEQSIGAYVRGVASVALFVGLANFLILTILRVPNAVTLAFIIGVSTTLPVIGGFIGGGTAIFLALLSTPLNALLTLASFVVVQQVETYYLTPRVMANSMRLNPILIILFLFIGFSVGGVIGGMLAVPIAGTIMILVRYLIIEPKQEEVSTQQVIQGGILLTTDPKLETKPGS